ncbi:MAG: hypothetical protein HONBIEJF_00553 [Fimbriimonadaceae bacterium]|nr:hypothetical protein [Fimbriimonadaceae bacterium]
MKSRADTLRQITFGFVGGAVFAALCHSMPAIAQTTKEFIVRLQQGTPGIAQAGHTHITGTALVGEKVGIGTTQPGATLHVSGSMVLDQGSDGPWFFTGTGSGELNRYLQLLNSPSTTSASGLKAGGILVSDAYDWANPGKNDLLVKGKVGVGTDNPQDPLSVLGTISSLSGGFRFPDGTVQTSAVSNIGLFNVKDYGAKGNGTKDDTLSFQAAIDAMNSQGGGTLYVPRGLYKLTNTIYITCKAHILGEGRQLSKLRWSAGSHGLYFDGGSNEATNRKVLSLTGLSFEAAQAGGIALQIRYSMAEGNVGKLVQIDGCEFTNTTSGTYWKTCVDMWNARETSITRCDFRGNFIDGIGFQSGTKGVVVDGDESPTGHVVDKCSAWFLDEAFSYKGEVEGVIMTNLDLVCNNYGIRWNTVAAKPQLHLSNAHISSCAKGVDLFNCSDGVIENVLFYQRVESPSSGAGVSVFGNSYNIMVTNSSFYSWSSAAWDGVVAGPNARRVKVTGNHFYDISRHAIWLQQGSRDAVVLDNDYEHAPSKLKDDSMVNTRYRPLP